MSCVGLSRSQGGLHGRTLGDVTSNWEGWCSCGVIRSLDDMTWTVPLRLLEVFWAMLFGRSPVVYG